MDYVTKLRMARAALGESQARLGERIGLSEVTVKNIENGVMPSARSLRKIAVALEAKDIRFTDHGVEQITEPMRVLYDYVEMLEDALDVLCPGDEIVFHRADDRRSTPEVVSKMNAMREVGLKFRSTICEGNRFLWGPPEEYRWISADLFKGTEVQVIYADRYILHERKKEANIYWMIKSPQVAHIQKLKFERYWQSGKKIE